MMRGSALDRGPSTPPRTGRAILRREAAPTRPAPSHGAVLSEAVVEGRGAKVFKRRHYCSAARDAAG